MFKESFLSIAEVTYTTEDSRAVDCPKGPLQSVICPYGRKPEIFAWSYEHYLLVIKCQKKDQD